MKPSLSTLLFFKKISTFFIIALPISGCFQNTTSHPQKTVSIVLNQSPKTLDPRYTTDANGQRLNQLIFQSLVRFDRNLNIIPDAAEKWTYNSLQKAYFFEMKENLFFEKNTPVSCQDLLFSFQEYQKDSCPFKSSFQIIKNVSCSNRLLKIELKEFSATFLTDLTVFKILPKMLVEKYEDSFQDHILGSGPYAVTQMEFNEIILTKKETATGGHIERFLFKIIQDDSTRFLNAYKGAIDIIPTGIPLNKISYLKAQNKYQFFTYPTLSMNYILIHFQNPLFQSPEARQALAASIKVDDIIKYKMEGFGEPATSLLPSANVFHNLELKPIPYNPELAKRIWKKLKVTSLLLKTSNAPEVVEIAKVLSEQLRQVGVELKIQSYEWGTFYGDIKKGQFELAMMRWVGVSDPDIYRLAFHSHEIPPGRNRGFYSNKTLDPLLLSGTRIENIENRKKHYNLIQKIVFDDLAIIPLWYNYQVDLISHRIKNYQPAINGDFTPFLDIDLATPLN